MAIFHDMVERIIKEFMDNFLVFGPSFDACLHNLNLVLQRCEDTNLVLNWENVISWKEGILLGRRISKKGIEMDRVKIEIIEKLPPSTNVRG